MAKVAANGNPHIKAKQHHQKLHPKSLELSQLLFYNLALEGCVIEMYLIAAGILFSSSLTVSQE